MSSPFLPLRAIAIAALAISSVACTRSPPPPASAPDAAAQADPHAWLESIDGERALDWVGAQNRRTDAALRSAPEFDDLLAAARSALQAEGRLPDLHQRGDWFYELHRAPAHPRGVYRRIAAAELTRLRDASAWQDLLDVDALAAAESTPWVWRGATCLAPQGERCMVALAPGGSDAAELREYDVATGRRIAEGFRVPAAKSAIAWLSRDELLIATDFGPGTMSAAGYPRVVKRWRRGTALSEAVTVFTAGAAAYSAQVERYELEAEPLVLLAEGLDFWSNTYYELRDGGPRRLDLPAGSRVRGTYADGLLVWLARPLSAGGRVIAEGALVYASLASLRAGNPSFELIATPNERTTVEEVAVTGDGVLVGLLDDIRGRLELATRSEDGTWSAQTLPLPRDGSVAVMSARRDSNEVLVRYEDFLTPPSLYLIDAAAGRSALIAQQPATFDAAGLVATRHHATSADGTRVPYTMIARRDLQLDGTNPTNVFAYGGFRNSIVPSYSGSYEPLNGAYGSLWLARGGVYVVANIRGGGEYGPAWHRAALRDRRPRAFEDLEAVAESLIERGITAPPHLAIEGRSNGGLLVGAVMTRRPDLIGAVVCGVPLLDMRRYHTLLAGASWIAEYGDPDNADDWAYLETYSPYHNLQSDADYPAVLLYTSTRDDRVHPAHARKMAAALLGRDQEVYYYENLEGGHKGASTDAQLAYRLALQYSFLWKALRGAPGSPTPR